MVDFGVRGTNCASGWSLASTSVRLIWSLSRAKEATGRDGSGLSVRIGRREGLILSKSQSLMIGEILMCGRGWKEAVEIALNHRKRRRGEFGDRISGGAFDSPISSRSIACREYNTTVNGWVCCRSQRASMRTEAQSWLNERDTAGCHLLGRTYAALSYESPLLRTISARSSKFVRTIARLAAG